jgi:hypothetical protein
MAEIRKESYAAEKLRTAKQIDTPFVPLDYNYGQNFQGQGVPGGTQTPDQYREKLTKKDGEKPIKRNKVSY